MYLKNVKLVNTIYSKSSNYIIIILKEGNKMLIKMNEAIAQEFISKYRNYGAQQTNLINDYFNAMEQYKKECRVNGTSPTLEEFEKIYPGNPFDIKTKTKDPLEDEIKQVLSGYTQEMLVLIETMSSNYLLNQLISNQIMENNSSIRSMVDGMESGYIFEDLNNMNEFAKTRLLQLRESDEYIKSKEYKILRLPSNIKSLIIKSFEDDLSSDKAYFCIEHDLNSEEEFLFYQKAITNQKILEIADDIKQMGQNDTGVVKIVSDHIDDMAYSSLHKSTIIIPPDSDIRKR